MYEYSMYPDTSTGTHLFIRRVPVLRPRTAVPEGIRQGTSILNLVCTKISTGTRTRYRYTYQVPGTRTKFSYYSCSRYLLNLVQYRYVYAKYIVNLATEFTMYFPYTKKFKIRYFKIVVRYACNT